MAFPKMPVLDPNAGSKDYGVDWRSYLQSGEIIALSEWILPTGIEEDPLIPHSHTNGVTQVWLQVTGTPQSSYAVTNRIKTDQGRSEDQTIVIPCKER